MQRNNNLINKAHAELHSVISACVLFYILTKTKHIHDMGSTIYIKCYNEIKNSIYYKKAMIRYPKITQISYI
ncbi:hypothetical protein SAMN02745229_00603 [Butyrivibrio fibrisolvens DSM 3071]|uniref:Uncharacterized protein n=1 Tax=Butyrivibrio fibrisolvens DSM 3071 TaxID=1121131 RepID=A0A1M5TRY6_BUTFI|nr:hypothetical protein SAMN02745229_00603 [Butyrivibrio fibrisolvens DSM 3071]